MRRVTAPLALVLTGVAATHCGDAAEFMCSADSQCVSGETVGVCQPNNYCSFADPACESGYRYGSHAPASIAKTCVPVSVADGGGTGTTPAAQDSSGEGSTGPGVTEADSTTTTATTGAAVDSTTTSGTGAAVDSGSSESAEGSTTSVEACPSFFDDFEDGVIDAAWNQAFPSELEEVDGELFISMTADDTTDAAGVQLIDTHVSHGQVTLELGDLPVSDVAQTVFVVLGPNGEHLMFVVSPTTLMLRVGDGEPQAEQPVAVDFEIEQHRWLRFTIDEPIAHFEVSGDGTDWDELLQIEYDWSFAGGRVDILATNWGVMEDVETVSGRRGI